MKKALIVALICLIVGAVLIGVAWVFLNPADMNTVKDVVKVYHISEAPQEINITTTDSRVVLCPIEGDEWRVECMDKEKLYHTVELVDGVLTIKQIDTRQWYEYIGILNGFQNLTVTVRLPAKVYESLSVHSTSGGIRVEEGLIFSNATLQNTSGSINCASVVAGALNAKNTSGSTFVNGRVGGNLNVKNTSGSIHILSGVNGNLDVTNGSGRIEIANATPASVTVKNTSGGIYLENVVCQGACEIRNTSGSIELERCDATSFDLKNTSGGIRASILSDKVYDCQSTSGDVHTPGNGEGGTFKARTVSGSIRVEIIISTDES